MKTIQLAVLSLLVSLLVALPAAATKTKPKHKGFITGTLMRHDSGEPISRQWITLRKPGFSRSASTDTYGRFRIAQVPPGMDYTISFYHSGYKVRSFGPFDVVQDQATDVGKLEAVPVAAQVAPYTYSDTYLPGQNITVMVRSIRVTQVDVDVFKVPTAELRKRRGALIDRKRLTLDPSWKPLLSYRQPVTGGHNLNWRTTKVEPAFNDAGFYIVRVRGAGTKKLIPIFVTRLSLITKRTPTATWVWATDLETGKPIKGVNISGEATGKDTPPASLLKPVRSRGDGLARVKGKHARNIRYWGVFGDNIAYVDTVPASAAQSLSFRTYVYTDRPAYRPADQVNYKIIARANDGGAYRVVPGEKWAVVVRDPDGQIVHRGSHRSNLFGTFHGDLTLGDSPALGTYTVEARAGAKVSSGRFKVLEYRKPEYKLSVSTVHKQYVQGTDIEVGFQASYYFGAPLANRKVSWTVYETPFRPWWYDSYWGAYEDSHTYGYGRVARSGTVELDSRGRGTVKIAVDRAGMDRWVTVEAVVSDSTNRQVSARHKVMVTRGMFRVGIRPQGKIFKVGETASFKIDATRFDGAPSRRDIEVTASLETFSTKHKIWIYRTLNKRTLTTDPTGKVTYNFPVKQDGFIRVEAKGRDRYNNPIVESSFIWATKNDAIAGGYKKKSLDILPDKSSYQPGETARVLINTSRDNPWVLFAVEGDGVFQPKVVKVVGNSRLFEVPLSGRHAPNVYLSVAFAAGKSFYSLSKSINVSPAHRLLKVKVKPTKRVYEPGKTAVYDVTVTDAKGRPAAAELSLGLVDEAVYAISKELAPKLSSFFYGHRPNPVRTAYSFPSRYLGGADKDGDDDAGAGVRRDFKDTAFWKAVVHTGADGKARVEVPLPDNLTTWRLTVRAVSKDTLVGSTTNLIQTSKDLIATLALPRFFRRGDKVHVVAMIHNRGEDLDQVTARLEVEGAGASVAAEAKRTFSIKGADSRALSWAVDIDKAGAGAAAKLRVYVQSGKLKDAEERTVPVYAVAVDRLEAVSGMASISTSQTFDIPEGTIPGTAHLKLSVASTLAGPVMESLEDLAKFPYGCVEQTMNSFLPDLVADKVLRKLKVPRSGELAKLPQMVRSGLRKLYGMQHSDGGWGWWNGDSSHPFMTAYAVYGLARAKALGWDVRESVLRRGVSNAIKQYKRATDWNTRSFIAYAVSHAPDSKARTIFLGAALPELAAHLKALNSYSLATLVLANVAAERMAEAKALAPQLKARAVVTGDFAHFPGRAWRYTWTDNAKEATAYAVRAMLAVAPGDSTVPKAVRWLMRRRRGGMWDTTKDTAAAVEALTVMMETSGELDAQYTANVSVNGRSVGTISVTPESALTTGKTLRVPQDLLKTGGNELSVRIDGRGTLYWTGSLRMGAPPTPRAQGLGVIREYWRVQRTTDAAGKQKITHKQVNREGVSVGDEIEVRTYVFADRDYEYLAVEDPLPAGFEVIPVENHANYTRREVRDEKVAFFATRIKRGKVTIKYTMRAEMAGTVTASPTTAWLMYMPEVAGNSSKDVLTTHSKVTH